MNSAVNGLCGAGLRRLLRAFALVLFAAACREGPPPGAGAAKLKPLAPQAILWFVLDGVRVDHLGLYGRSPETMPALARLGASGLVFENAFASSTGTNAALASSWSGLEPATHGLGSLHELGRQRLRASVETLAESLQALGWSTLAVTALPQLSADFSGLAQGFGQYLEAPIGGQKELNAQEVYYRALRALEPLLAGQESFFACVHFADARSPEAPDPNRLVPFLRARLLPSYAGDASLGPTLARLESDPLGACKELARLLARAGGSPVYDAYQAALHDARLATIDYFLAQLLAAVEQSGRLSQAWVVVTGTRGEIYERNLPARESAFSKTQITFPCLLSGPGLPARRISATVRAIDIVPTLRAALGLSPLALAGVDLIAYLSQSAPPPLSAHVSTADSGRSALFDADFQLESDARGALKAFVRWDGIPLSLGVLSAGQRLRLAELESEFARRSRAAEWCLEYSALTAQPLGVRWHFDNGYVRSYRLGQQTTATQAVLGEPTRLDGTLVLEASERLYISGSRRSLDLRWQLQGPPQSFDEDDVWIGNCPLSASFLPRLPSAREEAWPQTASGEELVPLVDFEHRGERWWRLSVAGEPGRAVRLLLLRTAPQAAHDPLHASPQVGEVAAVPGRADALWLTGKTPFEVHLQKTPAEELALAVAIDAVLVPAAKIRWRGRRFAPAGEINLYLPAWLDGVSDALDSFEQTSPELAPGTVRLWRSTADLCPLERSPATREQLEFVRWLEASE